jgi:hypothetical protein
MMNALNKELSNGFVDLGTLTKLYKEAKQAERVEVAASIQEAALAVANSAAFATTLPAFATESGTGGKQRV